jgi:predicted  nucleic acid-binding Zn-ribbon protein
MVENYKKQIEHINKEYESMRVIYIDTVEELDAKNKEIESLNKKIEKLKGAQKFQVYSIVQDHQKRERDLEFKLDGIEEKYKSYIDDLTKELTLSKKINKRLTEYSDKLK